MAQLKLELAEENHAAVAEGVVDDVNKTSSSFLLAITNAEDMQ
jgi:hypothetical protein